MSDTLIFEPLVLTDTASEGGHWYTEDGRLVEAVRTSKGEYRKPTLRDARKFNLAPGVTTIIGSASAPSLTRWLQRQAILAALTLPRRADESEADWMARVEIDMGATARAAAEEGTRIHAALECHFDARSYDSAYAPHVAGVDAHLRQCLGEQHWMPEKCVVHPFGYATKADLHSEPPLAGDAWLVDFKGKDGPREALAGLGTFESHWMQLAATRAAIARELRCGICYVSRTHPGACWLVEVQEDRLLRGWEMFKALLAYWQAKTGYRPRWAQEIG